MNDITTDPLLHILRLREKLLEREYIDALAKADTIIAVANARLTEVRELIEGLTAKPRGRPKKRVETSEPTIELAEVEPSLIPDEA